MEPSFEPSTIHCYPKLGQCLPLDTLHSIDITRSIFVSSGRSINFLHIRNLLDDEPCPPCDCKDAFSMKRTSAEVPKCKFFMWKEKEMEEGYYKDQLHKMRFELKRKKDFSDVLKIQKKLVKLQQAIEADKQVFKTQFIELMKQYSLLKCGIFVMVIVVIDMWLKCP
ncbi:unnamed protein product [Lactuca saligna]|uniref:Uncharacterized protein n=1 Tax=Lactuca saligna TaxID=75948 RepID=A0AA35YTB8_LACSI|nr:unnamed protein product [Lactuca saligna]